MPWTAAFDETGPRNGDVIVRTSGGRLVALIYAAANPEETMRRAGVLLGADPARKAVSELTSDDMAALSPSERLVALGTVAAAAFAKTERN